MSEQIEIEDVPSTNGTGGRFEARVDGVVAATADYTDADGVRSFPHTFTKPAYRGRGLASQLVDEALRATVARGLRIRPACPFVAERADSDEFSAHRV